MTITGSLQDLSLPNLIQMQCAEPRRTQVLLQQRERQGRLIISDGELIYANVDELHGDVALYDLLTWKEAEFRVTEAPSTLPRRNIFAPWSTLVLEGLARADETGVAHPTTLQAMLHDLIGKYGVRDIWATDPAGQVLAAAKDSRSVRNAALTAFIAERARVLAGFLSYSSQAEVGEFEQFLVTTPTEKLWIENREGTLIGAWLEPRGSSESLEAALASQSSHLHSEPEQDMPI